MPVIPDNLATYLSGGAGNTAPASSIGGAPSTTKVNVTTLLHNIFDKVTGDEADSGKVNYRVVYVKNDHASLTAEGSRVHLESVHDSGTQTLSQMKDIAIGLIEAVNVNAQTLANEDTVPTGTITWNEGVTRADGIALGDIPFGQSRAVYLRRIIAPGAAAADDAEFEFHISADTAE